MRLQYQHLLSTRYCVCHIPWYCNRYRYTTDTRVEYCNRGTVPVRPCHWKQLAWSLHERMRIDYSTLPSWTAGVQKTNQSRVWCFVLAIPPPCFCPSEDSTFSIKQHFPSRCGPHTHAHGLRRLNSHNYCKINNYIPPSLPLPPVLNNVSMPWEHVHLIIC